MKINETAMPCSRFDVIEVLSDVVNVLYRAKFQTNQIGGLMHWVNFQRPMIDFGARCYGYIN